MRVEEIVLGVIATLILGACSSGGGSSSSTPRDLTSSQISTSVNNVYPNLDENVSTRFGFSSLVEDKVCDFYFQNSTGANICLNTGESEFSANSTKVSVDDNGVDYFVGLPAVTQDQLDSNLSSIDNVTKKPLFTSEFPINFETHDNYNSYSASGKVCTDNGVVSMKTGIDGVNNDYTVDMVDIGNGCYQLPDITGYGVGSFAVSDLVATDSNGNDTSLEGVLGEFTVNEYSNELPDSNISSVGDYSTIDGAIRDVNGNVTFNCSGSDAEGPVDLSAKYGVGSGYTDAVLDSDDNFDVNVSNLGGNTLETICSATDSFDVKVDSSLSNGIHKNTTPVYVSGLVGDVNCTVGESVGLGTAVFNDVEGDSVSVSLNQTSPFECTTAGVFKYKASGLDAYGLSGVSDEYNITVESANNLPNFSVNNLSCVPNDNVTLVEGIDYNVSDDSGIESTLFSTENPFTCPVPGVYEHNATVTANDGDILIKNYNVTSDCPSGQIYSTLFRSCNDL